MNEQILTKLALQASDRDGWLDREKFAELIVRECAKWIENTDSDSDIGKEDADALLDYFGIKQ